MDGSIQSRLLVTKLPPAFSPRFTFHPIAVWLDVGRDDVEEFGSPRLRVRIIGWHDSAPFGGATGPGGRLLHRLPRSPSHGTLGPSRCPPFTEVATPQRVIPEVDRMPVVRVDGVRVDFLTANERHDRFPIPGVISDKAIHLGQRSCDTFPVVEGESHAKQMAAFKTQTGLAT